MFPRLFCILEVASIPWLTHGRFPQSQSQEYNIFQISLSHMSLCVLPPSSLIMTFVNLMGSPR